MSIPLPQEMLHWEGGVALWLVDLEASGCRLIALGDRYGLSAPAGQGTTDRLRTAARIALRVALAGYVGLEAARRPFDLTRAGKPGLAPVGGETRPTTYFNLAHCHGAALIAVSRQGPVGVDIETERRPRISDHRRAKLIETAQIIAPLDALPDAPEHARFLQSWVRLEALAKATGEGLGALLARLDDIIQSADAGALNGASFVVRDIHVDGRHWAAVSGTSAAMAIGPPPTVTMLPLDEAWIQDGLSGSVPHP